MGHLERVHQGAHRVVAHLEEVFHQLVAMVVVEAEDYKVLAEVLRLKRFQMLKPPHPMNKQINGLI
jgi:hypothetical protein